MDGSNKIQPVGGTEEAKQSNSDYRPEVQSGDSVERRCEWGQKTIIQLTLP